MFDTRMIRMCSEMVAQGMKGYFIREKDLRSGDIASLEKLGYTVYGIRQLEGKPFTIEKRRVFSHRVGLAVFPTTIIFPKREGMESSSPANYYTMNNQYSSLSEYRVRRDFAAAVNRPIKVNSK